MEIIDAHHHLWDLAACSYPWLRDLMTRMAALLATSRRSKKPIACATIAQILAT